MMNIYTGNVVTDGHGEVTVQLPEWFEVLNTDFRYQLTLIGQFAQATARKLGIRLWIMLRDEIDYEEFCRRGKLPQKGKTHAGMPDFNSGPARAVTGSSE